MNISRLLEGRRENCVAGSGNYAPGKFMKRVVMQVTVFFLCILGLFSLSHITSMNLRLSLPPGLYGTKDARLQDVLKAASKKNKTVLITIVNKQYTETNSMLDLLLESLRHGEGTQHLTRHLVVGALDDAAFDQCLTRGLHCYRIVATQGVDFSSEKLFLSEDYLRILLQRTLFCWEVLTHGYNFLFFDADRIWFRDPFTQLRPEDDVQMSCDAYGGKPYDRRASMIDAGLYFVRSNDQTIELYNRWYASRQIFPHMLDQDILDRLRKNGVFDNLGLKVRYLDTVYFSGFCQRSKDLRKVITLHANCCRTIKAKILDLRDHLHAWRNFMASKHTNSSGSWPNTPSNCSASWNN